MTTSVALLLLNGGIASTAIQPLDIFSHTGQLWNLLGKEPVSPAFDVTTASIDGNPVRTDRHLSLTPQCSFADLKRPDLVFVPAGGCELNMMVRDGYNIDKTIEQNLEVVGWLRKWASEGVKIAAVCSGVLLAAQAGLLDGRLATAHWGLADLYQARFPNVDWRHEYLVTDAGDVFCGGGGNAASDLSLYIVEKYCGREIAKQTARALVIEMPRLWQNSFMPLALRVDHHDPQILEAQEWISTQSASDMHFDELARRVGMSSRNFSRRFKEATGATPLSYLQNIRIAKAKRLLENTQMGIQNIAEAIGYADMIFFRNLFKRNTGMSPTDYRKRFGEVLSVQSQLVSDRRSRVLMAR
ncbi:MAG: helix-turn-helix domain-containing protein [Sphingorhabdus sp.]